MTSLHFQILINTFLEVEAQTNLSQILIFATAAEKIPPIGFDPTPRVTFTTKSKFPLGNTCANTLVLPLLYDTYQEFKDILDCGFNSSHGFGMP